jgi:hypothetical protein
MEEEINPLETNVKKDGKRNTPCMSKILRENRGYVIEFNACNKADDFKGKKRKEGLVDFVQQGSKEESELRIDLSETGEGDLRDQRQVSEVDLEKLITGNNNLKKQQKEKTD